MFATMETSCETNPFLDPNFALRLFGKFGQIRGMVNKIKFIVDEFQKNSEVVQSKTVKDNIKSDDLIEEGNRYFAMKDPAMLFKSLELYNEAICYAENGCGGNLGIGYANRSAVYFELEQFEICLENINLAKISGYSTWLMPELNKREENCFEQLKKVFRRNENEFNVKLTLNPHQNIPFAAKCLELKTDNVHGRYIATTEDINPGEIIMIEDSFVQVLGNDCTYQRCSNCLKTNFLNLLPCTSCTKAMFCSDACLQDAYNNFHRFECSIIDCLRSIGGQITMRLFLKAVQSFSCIEELINFCQSSEPENISAFLFDHSKELSNEQQYQQIHCLATNQEIRSPLDIFTHAMVSALFYYQLINYTTFKDLVNAETENCLIELMFRMELISTINCFNIDALSSSSDFSIIGTGIYQFSSLINHSCCPNVCPKFIDNKLILYTTRKIESGESISISYNGSHTFAPKQKRQLFLNEKYHFQCQCIACTNDFPLYSNMVLANIPEIHTNNKPIQLNRMTAEEIFQKCCSYLKSYDHHYPCKEIYSAKGCLSIVLSYVLTNGKFGFDLTIAKLGKPNTQDIVL